MCCLARFFYGACNGLVKALFSAAVFGMRIGTVSGRTGKWGLQSAQVLKRTRVHLFGELATNFYCHVLGRRCLFYLVPVLSCVKHKG